MVRLKISIPEGYLEPEVRWGFEVTKKRKEIWCVEMDLLMELDRVCKKHGLTYYADSGTLLGAIRHQGFIPWDDDLDVAMMREDYEKLCRVAPGEFQDPYFFQTEYTDPGTLRGHAQLRHSDTTAVLKNEIHGAYTYNQGIFIDIFPLDNCVEDDERLDRQMEDAAKAMDLCYQAANVTDRSSGRPEGGNLKRRLSRGFMRALLKGPGKPFMDRHVLFRRYEKVLTRYNQEETPYVMNFRYRKRRRPKAFYEGTVEVPFEFITIPVMKGYDGQLRLQFGDYMTPVQAGNDHGDVIFRTHTSYKDFLEKVRDRKRQKREEARRSREEGEKQ